MEVKRRHGHQAINIFDENWRSRFDCPNYRVIVSNVARQSRVEDAETSGADVERASDKAASLTCFRQMQKRALATNAQTPPCS
jgi:hypothetical protein